MSHKAGFVNIFGNPNVGKSTLMNALLGEKLSVITPKTQTTRHRILGILSGETYQIVFSDLPGVIKPHYKLQERMMGFVSQAFEDADVFLLMTEPGQTFFGESIVERIRSTGIPVIVLVNKVDTIPQAEAQKLITHWSGLFRESPVIPVSALLGFNLDAVRDRILDVLPENPPYFPGDELSDRNIRFFVSEIIREKILLHYGQEIPYSVEVAVTDYKEDEEIDRISATIFVARESQKIIIIGRNGGAIKRIGTEARKDIEQLVGRKVFLGLTVKVSKDWRDDDRMLNRFGYKT
ncbi:MAG: GTPase Era [Bacteroidales bacterium]|nr:GTPase Era [Bacteroidales bacterium]